MALAAFFTNIDHKHKQTVLKLQSLYVYTYTTNTHHLTQDLRKWVSAAAEACVVQTFKFISNLNTNSFLDCRDGIYSLRPTLYRSNTLIISPLPVVYNESDFLWTNIPPQLLLLLQKLGGLVHLWVFLKRREELKNIE